MSTTINTLPTKCELGIFFLVHYSVYGYLNKTRSSRDLEKETKRNIEVMWLLKGLQPDHNTISNFRRDNPKAIKKVFRATVEVAKHFNLIGGNLIAGDSTKLRAQNSKKNNFNQKKIDRHLAYIDNKLMQYDKQLSEADGYRKQEIKQEIEKHTRRKDKYKKIEKQLRASGESQVSTTDPESRHMITRNNITEVAYNVQTTVDAEHKLPRLLTLITTLKTSVISRMAIITFVPRAISLPPPAPGTKPAPITLNATPPRPV